MGEDQPAGSPDQPDDTSLPATRSMTPRLASPPTDSAQMDVFRPSDFPESSTVPRSIFYEMAAASIPDDPDMLLRAMYEQSRNPALLRLLAMREGMI